MYIFDKKQSFQSIFEVYTQYANNAIKASSKRLLDK